MNLDFVAKAGSIEKPELYLEAPFGERVTKIAFFGGANASGKTNILRVFSFMAFILTMINNKPQNMIPFVQYQNRHGLPTKLGVEFSMTMDEKYRYEVSLTNQRFLMESLYRTRLVKKRIAETRLFLREWDEKNEHYTVDISKELNFNTVQSKDLIQLLSDPINQHNSLIAVFAATNSTFRSIATHWGVSVGNLMVTGAESDLSVTALAQEAAASMHSMPADAREMMTRVLRKADIGFEQIVEQGTNIKNVTQYNIEHRFEDGTRMTIGFPLESTGTKRILLLTNLTIQILNSPVSSFAVLDEMDASVHPDVYADLVELYMSPATNRNNTQLFFSSHNYATLNQLDKQQIFLTERNISGQTEVWRLDEMKGVEARDNFYAKYMSGAYGAVPRR